MHYKNNIAKTSLKLLEDLLQAGEKQQALGSYIFANENFDEKTWKSIRCVIDDQGQTVIQAGDYSVCPGDSGRYTVNNKLGELCGCTGDGNYWLFKHPHELHAYVKGLGPLIMKHSELEKVIPVNHLVLTTGNNTVKLWDIGRNKLLMKVVHANLKCVALNQLTGCLATANRDGQLILWDSRSSSLIEKISLPQHYGSPLAMAFDTENLAIVLAQRLAIFKIKTIQPSFNSVQQFIKLLRTSNS